MFQNDSIPLVVKLQLSENNMTEYFSVSVNQSRLKEEALSWVGTPFHANGFVKGKNGGVSCVGLIYRIAIEIGLITEIEVAPPTGPIAWHQHNEHSLLNEFFRTPKIRKNLKIIEFEGGVMTGDLLPLKVGKTENHLSQFIDEDHVIHCHRKDGVIVSSLVDIHKFIGTKLYRIYK
jgi:hypothetical protein